MSGATFPKHLLDFQEWERAQLESLLETAQMMQEVLARPVKKVPALTGFTVATVFFEPSTRTRISFELAARRMSADVVSFTSSASSTAKGETYRDTLRTLDQMGIDAYILRTDAAGVPHQAHRWLQKPVINAGDGWRAHPTQALLDAFTLREKLGSLEGKKIAIVGDILHSRVARSNAELLPRLGAQVVACGPATLLPGKLPGASLTTKLREALEGGRCGDGPPAPKGADGQGAAALPARVHRRLPDHRGPPGLGQARGPPPPPRPHEPRRGD